MATCGSLHHFFEKPLPENPTLLESLASPWNQIKPRNLDPSSFTEIFGELHFQEKPNSPQPSSSCSLPSKTSGVQGNQNSNNEKPNKATLDALLGLSSKTQYSSSSSSSSSLQLCTEGLGFESSDDVEELAASMKVVGYCSDGAKEELGVEKQCWNAPRGGLEGCWDDETGAAAADFKRAKPAGEFPPPPITSIVGRQGKPSFFLKSYRKDGRFVLKEVKIPSQEFLHACREGGRLKLNFVVPDRAENRAETEQGEEGIGKDESCDEGVGSGNEIF
ncbi:hypothetical protein ACLOJK_005843 [Asimina triloba]